MIDVSKDIHSLTEFKRNTPAFLEQMRTTERALVLTINGKAEVVAMSAETFQKVREALELLDSLKALAPSLVDAREGRGKPAEQVFDELRKEIGSRLES